MEEMNHTSMEERTKTQRRFGSAFVVWCIVLSAMSALSFYELREFFVWNKLPLANQYKPPMSIDELLDRRWQEKQEYKLYQQTGMKTLLPIRNELDYRLFRQINLEEYLYGQDDYLFSEGSIRAYYGDDCIGVQQVLTYAEKTKLVQDSLKKMGINLIVAFVPGKPTLLPEFLPRSVNRFKRKTTNYELFAAACSEKSLHYIDFTAFFKAYQLISDYPIFSRHGSHLSFYAECLVVDSTIRYIENLTGRDLPDFTRSTLRTQTIPKFRDQDIWLKAQRYCLNQTQVLAYESPISYEVDSGFIPTRVLGIGDSYYRCFYYTNAMSEAFANGPYWYYFNTQISDDKVNPEVWEQDLRSALQKNQVVLIMANDANLQNLGNGFIDEAYMMFHDPQAYKAFVERKRKVKQAIKKIRTDDMRLRKLTIEAQQTGLSFDSLLRREALRTIK